MIAGLAEPVMGLADTAILGHLDTGSTAAIGGVGVAVGLFFLIFWSFVVLHPAMIGIVGRYLGQGKAALLDGLLFQLVLFSVFLGSAIWWVSSSWAGELLMLYNAEDEVLRNAVDYFEIRVTAFPLMFVTYMLFGVIQGLQNTRWTMWIVLMGAGLNLILDLVLVYGIEGFVPAMGVKGAAWGTVASQVLMLVSVLFVLFKKTPYRLRPDWKLHPEFMKTLGVAANFMARTLSLNAVLFMASRSSAAIGEAELAAHTMAIQVWVFSFFVLYGFSTAGQAMSGKLIGERSFAHLRWLSTRLLWIGGGLALVLVVVYLLGYGVIGHLLSNDEAAVTQFESIFWLLVLTLPVSAPAFTYDGLLKGMSEAKLLRNLMAIAACVFVITLVVLPGSLQAVWYSIVVWMAFRTVGTAWFFRRKLRRLEQA